MNGTGNDFVVIDARKNTLAVTEEHIRTLASRDNTTTKGCDQLIVIEPSDKADAFMRIYNADGSQVGACGNATRCIGWLLMQETRQTSATIQTQAGILECIQSTLGSDLPQWQTANGLITANMGTPKIDWQDIPLSNEKDTLNISFGFDALGDATCVNMGNPHVIFFVGDITLVNHIEIVGNALQDHTLLPQAANITIAHVSDNGITLRVWERGVGLTASCGTATCATIVAATRRGLIAKDQYHTLTMQNPPVAQTLMVKWDANDTVLLHGPVVKEFTAEASI